MSMLCPKCECALMEVGWSPSVLKCPVCGHEVYKGGQR